MAQFDPLMFARATHRNSDTTRVKAHGCKVAIPAVPGGYTQADMVSAAKALPDTVDAKITIPVEGGAVSIKRSGTDTASFLCGQMPSTSGGRRGKGRKGRKNKGAEAEALTNGEPVQS